MLFSTKPIGNPVVVPSFNKMRPDEVDNMYAIINAIDIVMIIP